MERLLQIDLCEVQLSSDIFQRAQSLHLVEMLLLLLGFVEAGDFDGVDEVAATVTREEGVLGSLMVGRPGVLSQIKFHI